MLGGNAGEQKLSNDPDYKANQQASQQRWCENNPDYWQRYRASHPKYTQRNRELQRLRNQKCRVDASAPIAKRYALIAKLDVISDNYVHAP